MKSKPMIVAFEPDLLFSSRIESVSENIGVNVKVIVDFEVLLRELKANLPRVLILNLDSLNGKPSALEPFTQNESCAMIGYYSHVNLKVAEEARRTGIGTVVSRGAFMAKMKELLANSLSRD